MMLLLMQEGWQLGIKKIKKEKIDIREIRQKLDVST
jgi:hypothetical protein